jgi:hypothetical protein
MHEVDLRYDNIFIFGAGASFNTHPTIEHFFVSIEEALRSPDNMPFEKFRNVIDKIKRFKTPDSYARHLFETGFDNSNSEEYLLIKELYNTWVNYFTQSDFYPGVYELKLAQKFEFLAKVIKKELRTVLLLINVI